jgi:outer membrane murein-binding lipoprotein Lpp
LGILQTMRLTAVFFLSATVLLAGCSNFPELDDAISPAARKAGYPTLVPISQIIAGAADVQISPQTVSSLKTRAASLKSRASRLRNPVIDRQTRARLRAAIKRHR